ncbi:TadE/TadG family type IV pilus assembly protein [uncultured Phycicoccus sp.]|uniref:TadE/TadG family type IV pilus assembly protein n=1 Tax=uncultured Phycicoccus sp. TaxID=661422 RepID=UPI00261964C8|nr:TadE/TadG family type IV pilus assembly protein [uncultured Phycicoccus sp.]
MTARRDRTDRGAAAVEFALLLPVLFLIIGATIDFGRFFYTQNITVNAAREGARMMALGYPVGTPATNPSAARRVSQAMIATPTYTATYRFIPASGSPVVNGACPTSGAQPGDHVDVTVTVDTFSFMVLDPAFKILGGSIAQPKPSGTADVRCGG